METIKKMRGVNENIDDNEYKPFDLNEFIQKIDFSKVEMVVLDKVGEQINENNKHPIAEVLIELVEDQEKRMLNTQHLFSLVKEVQKEFKARYGYSNNALDVLAGM